MIKLFVTILYLIQLLNQGTTVMSNDWKKYPRTAHLPFSGTMSDDDKRLESIKNFIGREVVVTEKLDGEAATIYNNGMHARSLNNTYHSSRAWLKALQAMIASQIPDDMRITGENVYAKHTIHYQKLSSYFYVYGIFENGYCLPWDDIEELCQYFKYSLKVKGEDGSEQYQDFHLETVPVLYRGIWDEEKIKACYTGISKFGGEQEGYVVRIAEGFVDAAFPNSVAKYVKENFILESEDHWMTRKVIPNKLERSLLENIRTFE